MGVTEQRRGRLPSLKGIATAFFALLLGTVLVRHWGDQDANKCQSLMTKGQWYHNKTWVTPGCASEPYDRSSSIHSCFKNRRIVLVGDESIQSIYWAMVETLDGDLVKKGPVDHDLHFDDKHLELDYRWDPFLNISETMDDLDAHSAGNDNGPSLMVVGSGRWHVENNAVLQFNEAIDGMVSNASSLHHVPRVGEHLSQKHGPGDIVLFMPVQETYSDDPATDPDLEATRQMNSYLEVLSSNGQINLLSNFNKMTRGRPGKFIDGGPDVNDGVSRRRRDVILGLRCNTKIAAKVGFPYKRTCCAAWTGLNWIQVSFLSLGLAILPALILADSVLKLLGDENRRVVRALCAFTSAVSLLYIADRTHIFEQVTRLPLRMKNLYAMLVAIGLIGLLSTRRSKPPKSTAPNTKPPDQPFLPRDQSDEMKGYMQALIITYHYNKAWTSLWFWEVIRLTVSSYLFLTGFGHTVYFLSKSDYSLKRFVAVLLRTNLLPVTLAYVLRTRWLLYYYMPLSTFWFIIVYATLAIAPSFNNSTSLLLTKIAVSASLVQAFINTPELPETVVRFFAITCNISFDAQAFFDYRVRIDAYIPYVGMVAAKVYLWATTSLASSTPLTPTAARFRTAFPFLRTTTTLLAVLTLPIFAYLTSSHLPDFLSWTTNQPWLTPFPILSFLILRNAHPTLRTFHSAAFAWLGRYSGEMYVLQNHLWLAGDQEAVLRTGFWHGDETLRGDRWRDLVLLTGVYLGVCCGVGDATGELVKWFVGDSAPGGGRGAVPDPDRVVEEVEMGLLDEAAVSKVGGRLAGRAETADEWCGGWAEVMDLMWPHSLRSRVLLLLGCLWALNMTYT